MSREVDVCIVGGGPAGLAAAIAVCQRGFTVTLVERAIPPIDKACGEGLLPDAVAALRQLDIAIPSHLCSPIQGIRFVDEQSDVSAAFVRESGVGVRRTLLHHLLMEKAEEAGARLIWGAKSVRVLESGVEVSGEQIRARIVLGADGHNSAVRRNTGLDHASKQRQRFGFRRHYRIAPWSSQVEVLWCNHGQVYLTPISDDEVGVAVLSNDASFRVDRALAEFPEIAERLACARPVSVERGSITVTRRLRAVQRGNVALIGDASGSVDAITGEGLGLSFRQALAFARALQDGGLHAYQRDHEALSGRMHVLGAALVLLDRHPALRRRTLAAFARRPNLFRALVSLHIRELAPVRACSHPRFKLGERKRVDDVG